MGAEDMRRQRPNVERMGLLGAEVRPVEFGTKTLKEATSEAIRDWIATVETTHYLIGSCVGPHPYPELVRELQSVIGREAREQLLEAEDRLPEVVVACVGGGSNAIGHVRRLRRRRRGAADRRRGRRRREPRRGPDRPSCTARAPRCSPTRTGRSSTPQSISAGLDYPGVGPEHAFLRDTGRVEYVSATRRRGAGRVPEARADRGHPPRARAGARARPGGGARRGAGARVPLRPRRQGPRRGARARVEQAARRST